jgi:hypothetical protein
MTFLKTWDETNPADTKSAALGADDIRTLAYAIRERLAIDHYFLAVEGGDAKIGFHKSGTFIDVTNDLLGVLGAVRLYGKTVGTKVELFLVMTDNTVVQLTSNGKLNSQAIDGVIPIANLATGTPDGTQFVRDDGALAVALQELPVGSVFNHKIVADQTPATGSGSFLQGPNKIKDTDGDPLSSLNAAFGSITPKKIGDKIVFKATVSMFIAGGGNSATGAVAIFTNLSSEAIATGFQGESGAGNGTTVSIMVMGFVIAADLNPITPQVRVGGYAGGWATYASNVNVLEAYEEKA